MRHDGEPIPRPSSMDVIMADRHNRNAVAFLVDLPTQSRRAIRINVSLPEDVVQSIDRVAANRSRFLADAARERLKRQKKSA
jgi:HicB_like antitoxin of bacterial toxin-antitoxin system